MECLRQGFAAATCFFAFPKAHWKRLRSTNGLERLHGEVKRRIRGVGTFPDRASALRLFTAVALEVTGVWDDRRYLDMSLPNSTPDTAQRLDAAEEPSSPVPPPDQLHTIRDVTRSADVTGLSQPRSRGLPGGPPLGVPTALRPLHRARISMGFALSKDSA